jgi:phosphohistidine phosphatase
MKLFLVRHGHALEGSEDPRRPLSARGREIMGRVAVFLRAGGVVTDVHAIWHSPLVRSRETAELLREALGLDALLIETTGLMAEDDPVIVADRLERMNRAIMIVGHEPQLGALATLLVCGTTEPVGFEFTKSAVLALEATSTRHKESGRTRWRVCWQMSPELLSVGAQG